MGNAGRFPEILPIVAKIVPQVASRRGFGHPQRKPMTNTQQVIYSAATVEQAHLLMNILREHGIYSHVSNGALQFAVGDLPFGVPTAPRVVVHEDDSQEARRIALEFDRTVRNLPADEPSEPKQERRPFQFGLGTFLFILTWASIYFAFAVDRTRKGNRLSGSWPFIYIAVLGIFWVTWYLVHRRKRIESATQEGPPTEDLRELEEEADARAAEWPVCPHCGRPRHTSCPICETAGTKFPTAFMPDGEQDDEPATTGEEGPQPSPLPEGEGIAADRERLLVVCPTCDEVFEPRFPARCEWCGHRFRDGYELPPAPPLGDSLEINNRAWIVFVGVVALVGAVLALFAYIARTS
jgi:Putative prokaryotic signal transducing protein